MFITRMDQNKIFIKKEVRKIMEVENGDYIEYMIEHIHGIPHVYMKKHHKLPEPRILGKLT